MARRIDAYGLQFASEARDELTLPAFIGNTRLRWGAPLPEVRTDGRPPRADQPLRVALVIGILLVGQLRSQARPIELSSLSAQELSTLIETLSARNVELSDGLANLREQIRDYERAELQGQSVLELTEEDVDGAGHLRRPARQSRARGSPSRSTARSTRPP